ncbi:DUF4387 domain-containing protein [Phenylobacterium sp.]|uniref:DUF4387 domain-containing protein n=1 Tax=Phenylobacterium sp. TaxID=1871053 RepID=UPI0035B36576
MKLHELTALIRSKNAGPFVLTFDIIFRDRQAYERTRAAGVVSTQTFADLFHVDEAKVRFFDCENALAMKFSIPRPVFQGDIGDTDMHGGQQFVPLMNIEVP